MVACDYVAVVRAFRSVGSTVLLAKSVSAGSGERKTAVTSRGVFQTFVLVFTAAPTQIRVDRLDPDDMRNDFRVPPASDACDAFINETVPPRRVACGCLLAPGINPPNRCGRDAMVGDVSAEATTARRQAGSCAKK